MTNNTSESELDEILNEYAPELTDVEFIKIRIVLEAWDKQQQALELKEILNWRGAIFDEDIRKYVTDRIKELEDK